MPSGRVIPKKLPACPGRDSRFTIRNNPNQNSWWVYYESPDGTLFPSDDNHPELVALVNSLKEAEGNSPGGGFSINEHFQVIARTTAPASYGGGSIHVVGLNDGGVIATYEQPLVFQGGLLAPTLSPIEGQEWNGPLCGMTYSFAAPGKS
jgi:hypothetical protein